MGTKSEVKSFLEIFRSKHRSGKEFEVWDRDVNMEGLKSLGITGSRREAIIIEELGIENYSSGPTPDDKNSKNPEVWIFGVMVGGREVYVKLTAGAHNCPPVCMSFHPAMNPLEYPLR